MIDRAALKMTADIAIVIATVLESAVAPALDLTEEIVADRDTDLLAETAAVPVIASGLQKGIETSTGPGREIGLALVAVLIVIERREAVHGIDINPSTESEADLRGVERTETNKTGPARTLALNAGMIIVTIDAMIDGTDPVHQSLEPREFARAYLAVDLVPGREHLANMKSRTPKLGSKEKSRNVNKKLRLIWLPSARLARRDCLFRGSTINGVQETDRLR